MMLRKRPCHARRESAVYRDTAHRKASLMLVLILFAMMPVSAKADCTFDSRDSSAPVNFSVSPATITLPFSLSAEAMLGNPTPAIPSNPPDVTCASGTQYGVVNRVGNGDPPTGGSNYVYPTGLSGVGYELINADDTTHFMGPYPNYTDTGGTSSFSVGTTLQLVQTGPIVNGSSLAAGTRLADWKWGSIVPEYFVLTKKITFKAPACVVNTTSVTVSLPTVSPAAFSGASSVAGTTPFNVQVTCPSGSTAMLSINFSGSKANRTYTNVLKNTAPKSTRASGVGVQLLDKNSDPITFNNSASSANNQISLGITPSGLMLIPLYARYFATGSVVGIGEVKATATFTLYYQ